MTFLWPSPTKKVLTQYLILEYWLYKNNVSLICNNRPICLQCDNKCYLMHKCNLILYIIYMQCNLDLNCTRQRGLDLTCFSKVKVHIAGTDNVTGYAGVFSCFWLNICIIHLHLKMQNFLKYWKTLYIILSFHQFFHTGTCILVFPEFEIPCELFENCQRTSPTYYHTLPPPPPRATVCCHTEKWIAVKFQGVLKVQ